MIKCGKHVGLKGIKNIIRLIIAKNIELGIIQDLCKRYLIWADYILIGLVENRSNKTEYL